jgi:glycosyltransferase involved in cell wall biosynthesis
VQEIQIKSSKSNSELASILQTAHFGALPFMLPISKAQRAIAHTMLATKTAEYLAAGLPILFNKYCGGISSIVERHNIGLSYDPAEPERVINSVALDQLMTLETRKLARKVAVQLFDSGLNATKYAQLYRDLIKENLR